MKKNTIKKVLPVVLSGLIATSLFTPSASLATYEANSSDFHYSYGLDSTYTIDGKVYSSKYQAKLTALEEVGLPAKITGFDVKLYAPLPKYTVLLVSTLEKHVVEIDAISGEVLDVIEEERLSINDYDFSFYYGYPTYPDYPDNDSDDSEDIVVEDLISKEEALEKAAALVSVDALLEEIDLDDNIYEIEMYDDLYDYEIEIDALSGQVLSFEKDN